MGEPRRRTLALLALVALTTRATGQASAPDLRTFALRNLQFGRTVRIAGPSFGRMTGSVVGVRDSALWLRGEPADRGIPIAAIDSVWVSQGHAAKGALVGWLVGSALGLLVSLGPSCESASRSCTSQHVNALALAAGLSLGGTLAGAVIGSESKSWRLRYP